MAKALEKPDTYAEHEAQHRFEAAFKGALKTPSKHRAPKKRGPKPAKERDEAKE